MKKIILGLLGLAHVAWSAPVAPPPPEFIPANAASVPRNTKVWVFDSNGFGVQVFGPSGLEVGMSETTITTSFAPALNKHTPLSELAPGQYEIRTSDGASSRFTVIDEVDTTPPSTPVVGITATGRVGQIPATVTITAPQTTDSFLVVLFEGQSWEASSVPAVGNSGSAVLYGLPAGETRLKVIQVDAAGNASEPADVVANVPAERSCSVAPVMPLSLLALMLLQRRRGAQRV